MRPLKETPSQTAGPYVHIGLMPGAAGVAGDAHELGHDIAGPDAEGPRIRIEGRVIDGTGTPVRDAVIEVWQANAAGIHAGPGATVEPGFRGWGRVATDPASGGFAIDTVKPGAVPGPGPGERMQAPHLSLWIVARGINLGLHTRLYFDDEPEANAADPVLSLIEWETRRATLIAARAPDNDALYRFDIRLQGADETVFFEV